MRFKVLALIAGLALVTACESAPDEGAAASGAGAAASSSSKVLAPAPGTQDDLVVNVGDRVFFDFDRYNLNPPARRILEKQAVWLKKYSKVTITVEGHTDERGTREYNLALGDRRANSTKDYLVSLGIDPNRVKTISYGKERPVALGSNEAAWAQNRRAVTVVNSVGS